MSVPWFWWLPPRGHPLPASLVLSRACVPGPRETNKRGDHSHWPPPPGHCTASQLGKKKLFFCEKGYCLSWSFSLKGRLLPWHTPGGHLGSLQGPKPGDAIFVLSLCPTPSVQYLLERNCTLVWCPDFFTAVQGTPLDHWVLLAKETDTCSPTGLCLSAYVKSC